MIVVDAVSKSFFIPKAHKRSVRGSLFSFFDRSCMEQLPVLKDFSFEVSKGEFVGVMGPNGSGKSTLLKLIAGVYQPDKGRIQIKGSLSAVLELGVGFHPDLSARENVFLHGVLLGFSPAQLEERFRHIFAFSELEEFMETPLKFFSSGMKARLAFALAMEKQADVYLMDEILAVGDEAFQHKCRAVFDRLKKEGKTVLLVSHSRELVDSICDRVIVLPSLAHAF